MKIAKSLFLVLIAMTTVAIAEPITGSVTAGASPGDQTPVICVWDRVVNVNGVNMLPYRTGLYAYTGESIEFYITVRDYNGAEDIGLSKIRVEGEPEVLCTETFYENSCDGLGAFDPYTDKAFVCILTVEPDWYDEGDIVITAYNSAFTPTDGTHVETWFFNPAVSMSVTTSDSMPIHFEDGNPGDWVHSENHVLIKNTAEGGVNMWAWIAGEDFYDTGGASLCPTSNVLELHGPGPDTFFDPYPTGVVVDGTDDTGLAFRGWTGTISGQWYWMSYYDENGACEGVGTGGADYATCYGGKPVPEEEQLGQESLGNLLTNQGTMQVEFKLHYPVPCIGTFDGSTIYFIGKAV